MYEATAGYTSTATSVIPWPGDNAVIWMHSHHPYVQASHFLQMHTTPPGSRGFGGFRTRLLIQLCHEIQELGAALSYPVQVGPLLRMPQPVQCVPLPLPLQLCCQAHTSFAECALLWRVLLTSSTVERQVTVEADENFFAPNKDANGHSAPRKAAAQFG
jgi:hypothetical protein